MENIAVKNLNSIEFCKQVKAYTSNFIYSLRKSRFVEQKSIANALGVSLQQLLKYEKGINSISLGKLLILCDYLKYDIHELIKELQKLKMDFNSKNTHTINIDKLTPKQHKIISKFIKDFTNTIN